MDETNVFAEDMNMSTTEWSQTTAGVPPKNVLRGHSDFKDANIGNNDETNEMDVDNNVCAFFPYLIKV